MITGINTVKGFSGKDIEVVDANYDNSKMDKEDFLKVLLANFKYQDPFEAQDIAKFIDNTVKLRELEVMNRFEDAVKTIGSGNELMLKAANLIGEKVEYAGDKTYFENGESFVEFETKDLADKVTIYLYDKDGNVIDFKEFENVNPGDRYKIEFSEENLEDGYYNIGVVAKKGDLDIDTTIYSTAKIEGVEKFENGIKLLYKLGSLELDDIVKIGG